MPQPARTPETDLLLEAAAQHMGAGKFTEAISLLRRVVDLFPNDPLVLERLADSYRLDGQVLPALRACDRLIELGAATASTWRWTGNLLSDLGEYAQALGAFEHGLLLEPADAEMHHNLAKACYKLGQVERAAKHLEIAIAQTDAESSWLSLATLIPGAPGATHQKVLEVRREFARRLAAAENCTPPRPRVAAQRRDRLRIGYVSSFFDGFNYMKPVWGLINHHDRDRFQFTLFSDGLPEKGMPGYQPHPADRIYQTADLTTPQLVDRIRDAEIDILVDLNGYSRLERLPLFLHNCAPLTVAWFNQYATSGLPAFDYIVGDDEVIRRDEEQFYAERVYRLPVSYLTFEVLHPTPPVVPPPCSQTGRFTFGSLVSQYKITAEVLDAWAEILRRTEGALLRLANAALKSNCNRSFVLDEFSRRGIPPERLKLFGPAPHFEYLRHYDHIDVALDAFPYNGGTTTMEAIWQGVPVLTFEGDRWASRTSQTLLRRCHLREFVARDAVGMVHMAVDMARDPQTPARLGILRAEMRSRLAASATCDTAALAHSMEQFYGEIWSAHVADGAAHLP
jgi:predicted O-linked N-acetylglucosamine transferase (SPINDLY family)